MNKDDNAKIDAFSRKMLEKGRAVEWGWRAMRLYMLHPNAPVGQVREMRLAFHAGASFLFTLLTRGMSEGLEELPEDLSRMEQLYKELQRFEDEYTAMRKASEAGRIAGYACPRCGAVSQNANDIREGYCGRCHDWTAKP